MENTKKQILNEDRQRIIKSYIEKKSINDISNILNINRSTIYSIVKIYQNENRIDSKKRGTTPIKKLSCEIINEIKS